MAHTLGLEVSYQNNTVIFTSPDKEVATLLTQIDALVFRLNINASICVDITFIILYNIIAFSK